MAVDTTTTPTTITTSATTTTNDTNHHYHRISPFPSGIPSWKYGRSDSRIVFFSHFSSTKFFSFFPFLSVCLSCVFFLIIFFLSGFLTFFLHPLVRLDISSFVLQRSTLIAESSRWYWPLHDLRDLRNLQQIWSAFFTPCSCCKLYRILFAP